MVDSIRGSISSAYQTLTKKFVAPPKESCFFDKGMLTPDEFIQVKIIF